ncbi:MAG TPA: peptide chain release factor H [Puia sp.]|nr:peptide chain release factor H [Puia sp.]
MEKIIIQITAGRGPVECSRVVARVQEKMLTQARKLGIVIEVLDNKKGDLKDTLLSATLLAKSPPNPIGLQAFIKEWRGTVQWIAPSPYRKLHKRKNWFVGVEVFDVQERLQWNPKEVVFETCRASGPGGQNVNKVETAVRGTHTPSGIQVLAMDSRSQWQNKQLCLERLKQKILAWQTGQLVTQQQTRWQEHNELERGNAVKTIIEDL